MGHVRKKISGEEFDYQALIGALKEYKQPRDKITALLRQGTIVRVKKGIYIFGKDLAQRPYSREVLANMIFGPSYISLDYALHYHGIIPERSEALTCVTPGRAKRFSTPVGLFIYRGIPPHAYPVGMDQIQTEGNRSFLIATAEKALADKIYTDRGTGLRSQKELKEYLLNHMRVDPDFFKKVNLNLLKKISAGYQSRKILLLYRLTASLTKEMKKYE